MSLFTRIFSDGEGPEQRAVAKFGIPPKWSEVSGSPEDYVNGRGALNLATFFSCVRLLADSVSMLPIKAHRDKDGVPTISKPQPKLMQDSPYPGLTWFEWLWMLMQSLAVTGNAFGYITARDGQGRPTAIMPIHPDCVRIEEADKTAPWPDPIYRIGGEIVDSQDVVHIRRYPVPGCVVGMSPIEKAASAIGLSISAERYGARWFRDSANPSGLLTSDMDLTPDQVKQTQKSWIQSHQNRRLPAVMSAGIKWQSISITPNESQFLETRQFQKSEIAMWFGIPPHMIGDTEKSTSWGSGIESMSIGFVTYTLMPWLVCIEQAFTTLLPRGQFAKFNANALLRGDYKTRNEGYQLAIQNGHMSPNEARALEERPPIPGGDIYLQPMNFVPLGYVPPEPPASNPPADSGEEGKSK
ncbi:portal protein [Mycobacterium phage Hannaconda]|uniref:Portal protein n=2 Tax=Omegavirus courthouse TaxID=1089119 RepID=G8I569_9CAUD|nr:portal protein [Mycobacterium phage Courthouse]YP_009213229.1 portal protein [Mycobacterium phage MiaZeal]ASD50654.1 portal protein [Mycobacterium phage Porcelain]ATS92855.1 portal protein [Mycobacterium phage Superphikiman]QGJ93652.1 portal protein [Mycobacterium phage Hannaconda]QPO16616.1 portal protein [Mycobacterium phage KashFlow]AER47863.1 portal protein [Mycobacterium phage Courthouse]